MGTFKDQFSKQAPEYARFRPEYPEELYRFLAGAVGRKDSAWDCATGNGQAARALARHFARIEATDASAQQLANATPRAGVRYRVAPAEASGLADGSTDLVTAATALHWFDVDRFFAEAARVLRKPGGVLAVWGYSSWKADGIPPEVSAVFKKFSEVVREHFAPELQKLWNGYPPLPAPFAPVAAPPFAIRVEWEMEQVLGFIHTWSATQNYLAHTGKDPCAAIRDELARAWHVFPDGRIRLEWPLDVRIGRIP